MNRKEMVKLIINTNKAISHEKVLGVLGTRSDFSTTDVGWIMKSLKGHDAISESTKNNILEFDRVNEQISKSAHKEGVTYQPLNLIQLLNTPKFSNFIAGRSPLKFHKSIFSVSDLVIKGLKED